MDSSDGAASGTEPRTQDTKAKRVRTGCLTCRERHLKCDETKPVCNNCAKSQRNCKVGVRLNFIDTQIKDVPHIIPLPENCDVVFQDESREIASEYKGGAALYGSRRNQAPRDDSAGPVNGTSLAMHPHPNAAHGNAFYMDMQHTSTSQSLPSIHVGLPDSYPAEPQNMGYDHESQQAGPSHHHNHSHSDSTFSTATMNGHGGYPPAPEQSVTPEDIHDLPEGQMREYLNSQEEVLFMQVFVEEVGLWMDSMDPQKHFSRLLPFHSLGEPMLLNAFLACGARHLSLVNSKYSEEKALHYYDTATRFLLDSLQNPDRNTVVCATTAVILNVYEIMCEKALQRMNHIAGARALIKECGWNARAIGIGAACFWLNVGMELLSCLHFNWQVAWDPDDWGVDMDFTRESLPGREEVWCYRMVYIVAKIANFRATIPRTQDLSQPNGQHRLRARLDEWRRLKKLADSWNESIPRTMHPMAYLYPGQTLSGSAFPEVWLIKRTSIVARLFYHTAMCLLAQINPVSGPEQPEMRDLQQRHSQLICGISAHVKDRGVASVALRSLAIAAECLTERREQEEVLQIFDKIRQETGWRVGFLNQELKDRWGWNEQQEQAQAQAQAQAMAQMQNGSIVYQQNMHQIPGPAPVSLPPAPTISHHRHPQGGILNPLLATADFNMPQHPYQSHYVAPNPVYQAPPHPLMQAPNYF